MDDQERLRVLQEPMYLTPSHVQCIDATGATQVVTATTTSTLTPGTVWEFPNVLCPEGMVASEFGADWTPSAPGSPTETFVPTTRSPDWVTAIPTQYPECLTQTCYLQLHRTTGTTPSALAPTAP